jgi:hypothetical protein
VRRTVHDEEWRKARTEARRALHGEAWRRRARENVFRVRRCGRRRIAPTLQRQCNKNAATPPGRFQANEGSRYVPSMSALRVACRTPGVTSATC